MRIRPRIRTGAAVFSAEHGVFGLENLGGIVNPNQILRLDAPRLDPAQTLLKINAILQGEVLELLDGGSVVIGVGRHRVPADSNVELKLGQKFSFQVLEQEGKIVLKVLPEPAPPPEENAPANSFRLFQQTAGKDAPLGEVLGKLSRALLALVGEPVDASAAPAAKLPGKPPLDASSIGFLREAALGLQAEIRAEWPQQAPISSSNPVPSPASTTSPSTVPILPNQPPVLVQPASVETAPILLVPREPLLLPTSEIADSVLPAADLGKDVLGSSQTSLPVPVSPDVPAEASPPPSLSRTGEALPLPLRGLPSLSPASLRELASILQRPELRAAIQAVARHLEGSTSAQSPQPETIRRNVEETGIPIESQLRRLVEGESRENPETLARKDIKTLLLRVENEIDRAMRTVNEEASPELRKALGEFGESVKQSRESVESKQVQNALRQDSGEPLHFQIPYHDFGRLKTADLYYSRRQEKEKKTQAERSVHHVVFLLDMSRIGKLRVDALVRGSRIQIAVNTAEDAAASFLRPRMNELQAALEGLGFEVGMLECRAGLPRSAQVERQDLDLPVLGERHLVDLEG